MAKSSDTPKITRIRAKDSEPKTEVKDSAKAESKKAAVSVNGKRGGRLWRYLKGSWEELRLVRWTDRKTTWKMTGALVVFTVTFGVIILLLDYVFQFVFKLLIGK